jgi:hypothetical protein
MGPTLRSRPVSIRHDSARPVDRSEQYRMPGDAEPSSTGPPNPSRLLAMRYLVTTSMSDVSGRVRRRRTRSRKCRSPATRHTMPTALEFPC